MADNRPNAENRIVGMMFGAAIGDAVGLYTENQAVEDVMSYFKTVKLDSTGQNTTEYFPDDHRSKFNDGSWTDDTDMALCVLLAYLETGQVSHLEIAARFRDWRNRGLPALGDFAPDIDVYNDAILSRADYLRKDTGGPLQSARSAWIATGAGETEGNGKGAIMRTHPLGAILGNRPLHEVLKAASLVAQVTHADPRCVISALIVTSLTRGLIRGEIRTGKDMDRMMQTTVRWYLDQRDEAEVTWYQLNNDRRAELSRIVTARSIQGLKLEDPLGDAETRSGGNTYKTLGVAIYCVREAMGRLAESSGRAGFESTRKSIFQELINEVAVEGRDASTHASVAGALLGAYLGYDAIPDQWKRGLRNREFLLSNCNSLCKAVGVIPGDYAFPSTPIFNEASYTSTKGDPDEAEISQRKAALDGWKQQRLATLNQRWLLRYK